MRVLAVDPGSRWVAMVVREGDRRVDHAVLERRASESLADWSSRCTTVADRFTTRYAPEVRAVEAAGAPNPHVGMTNPGPIIDTAFVAGALCERLDAVLIEPDGFGAPMPNRRLLLAAYPSELVGPRESTGSGKSKWQHLRAAWDLAQAARRVHLQGGN